MSPFVFLIPALLIPLFLSGGSVDEAPVPRPASRKDPATMNAKQAAFMARLRTMFLFPINVSSATRTAGAQARALQGKIKAGSTLEDLIKLYGGREAIREVVARPMAEWEAVLQAQVDRGVFLSRHMRGDALDLSVRGWTPAEIDEVVAATKQLGAGRAFLEHNPTHIHIEGLPA